GIVKYRFLKNISFSGIVNTIKIDLSILMSCKAGFLLTISLFGQQEVMTLVIFTYKILIFDFRKNIEYLFYKIHSRDTNFEKRLQAGGVIPKKIDILPRARTLDNNNST
ncbi:MAG: hypothetical protein J5901_00795, partial [Pseudobutyrivibrio sp.]|nr:hypothetical protein [Pseudobutyrivibrio sp.]